MNETVTCDMCARERHEHDFDYGPLQVIAGTDLGWYSGDDGELCGDCMTNLMRKQ